MMSNVSVEICMPPDTLNTNVSKFAEAWDAAQQGRADVLQQWLDESQAATATNELQSCLNVAALNNHTDVARVLLRARADANGYHRGGTPLVTAACAGHCDMIRFLAENGASVSVCDTCTNLTPFMHAMFHQQKDAMNLLTEINRAQREASQTGCKQM